jgi:hypothetical protein
MFTTTHLKLFVAAASAAATLATAAPAYASYGWPLKPFHQQHPVRGYFGDPRIGGHDNESKSFHFGIDISAPNGTAVYATLDGIASRNSRHPDVVIISNRVATVHEYWHVIPAVAPGARVVAYKTVVGHIEKPWAHVHFSESEGGVYVNPLRDGALTPYADHTRPTIHTISFEREGRGVGSRVSGTIDIVSEAWDTTPVQVPEPWANLPVAPAFVEWRLQGKRGLASTSWHVAADFRYALPTLAYSSIYATWTRQNHAHHHGRYRYVLAHGLDTRALPNGRYRVVVLVRDTRGNERVAHRDLTVANDV